VQLADGRPGDEDAGNGAKHAPFTESAHPTLHLIRRRGFLAGFEQQDRAVEVAEGGHPARYGDLVNDLDSAAPAAARDGLFRSGPGPGLGGFSVAEFGQRPGVVPGVPEIFRITRFGELEGSAVEEGSAQRPEVNVVEVRARTEVDLCGTAVEARDSETSKTKACLLKQRLVF
jgi:hypothetical protein